MSYIQTVILIAFGLFFATGLALGYLASSLLLKTVAYLSPWLPVWLWIGDIGLFFHAVALAATSAVGVIAVLANKSRALKLCTCILIGLVLVELTITIQMTTRKSALVKAINFDLKQAMQSSQAYYSTNLNDTQMWDEIQLEKNCCGIKGYRDWFSTSFGNEANVPDSCCLLVTKNCGQNINANPEPENEIITEGCLPTLMNGMQEQYIYYEYHLWLPTVISQIALLIVIIIMERKLLKKKRHFFIYNIAGAMHQDTEPLYKRLPNDTYY